MHEQNTVAIRHTILIITHANLHNFFLFWQENPLWINPRPHFHEILKLNIHSDVIIYSYVYLSLMNVKSYFLTDSVTKFHNDQITEIILLLWFWDLSATAHFSLMTSRSIPLAWLLLFGIPWIPIWICRAALSPPNKIGMWVFFITSPYLEWTNVTHNYKESNFFVLEI